MDDITFKFLNYKIQITNLRANEGVFEKWKWFLKNDRGNENCLIPGYYSSRLNSRISPGWHSNTLQIASSVLNRTALAFPVFSIDRLDNVISTFSESSLSDIFRFAIITSKFTMIGMA